MQNVERCTLYAKPRAYNITNGYKIESNEKLWEYFMDGSIVVCLLDKYLIINRKSYRYGRRKRFRNIYMIQILDFEKKNFSDAMFRRIVL